MSNQENNQLTEIEPQSEAEKRLSKKELAVYRYWSNSGQPKLSTEKQMELFTFFLHGYSCEDISRMHRGISVGQILCARVNGNWDLKKEEHMNHLLGTVKEKVQQTVLESVDSLTKQLNVTHRMLEAAIKKYETSGDDSELRRFGLFNVKGYTAALKSLLQMTGQDSAQQVQVTHTIQDNKENVIDSTATSTTRPLIPEEAAAILRLAAEAKKKKDGNG